MSDRVTYCDVCECAECPRYGDDCDGGKRNDDLINRADAIKTVIRKCSPICAWQVGTQQYPDCVVAEINALPSADAIKFDFSELSSGQLHDIRRHKANTSAEAKGDLISRQDAVNTIKRYKHRLQGKGQTYGFLLEEFEHQIPSAEAVHGEWKRVGHDIYECSLCHQNVMTKDIDCYSFCHRCGARMNKGGDDE